MNQQTRIEPKENVPLAPFTTLKIGGPARYFVRAHSEETVVAAVDHAERHDLPLFVLGGGSNILVSDEGFEGLVLQVSLEGIVHTAAGVVTAAAGEDWDRFVAYCVENDLAGVECLSGIPGFAGGTPVQNVGAYGQEVSETIVSVRCFDRREKRVVELSKSNCGFEYRKSIFNTTARERYIVLSVTYALEKGGAPKIAYRDLKVRFPDRTPTLSQTRDAVLQIRRSKSMVIDPSDPNARSAGSFFKNPVVPGRLIDSIRRTSGNDSVPAFPASDGDVKIAAAWLIEQAGFGKGYKLGRAGISSNHSLALVNLGGATATEMIELKSRIQSAVLEKFAIQLRVEPIFVGRSEANLGTW